MTTRNQDAGEPEIVGISCIKPDVDLEASDYYREEGARSKRSAELVQQHLDAQTSEEISEFSRTITSRLEELLILGKLDGITIASSDGLVIAESTSLPNGEIMAAIGAVFESVVDRARHAGIIADVDEMTLLGSDGEMAIVRYFPNLGQRFFLIAYARKRCTYRRITSLAVKKCGPLLERKFGKE